jgi:hypothetical protein
MNNENKRRYSEFWTKITGGHGAKWQVVKDTANVPVAIQAKEIVPWTAPPTFPSSCYTSPCSLQAKSPHQSCSRDNRFASVKRDGELETNRTKGRRQKASSSVIFTIHGNARLCQSTICNTTCTAALSNDYATTANSYRWRDLRFSQR